MCGGDEQQMIIQVLDVGFQIHTIWYRVQPKLEQIQKQTQREVTAIVGDRNTAFFRFFTFWVDQLGQTFSCLANNIDINTVSTSTDQTTHTSCTEFKVGIEGIFFVFHPLRPTHHEGKLAIQQSRAIFW